MTHSISTIVVFRQYSTAYAVATSMVGAAGLVLGWSDVVRLVTAVVEVTSWHWFVSCLCRYSRLLTNKCVFVLCTNHMNPTQPDMHPDLMSVSLGTVAV